MSRNAVAAKKAKQKKIDKDELNPKVAAGLALGAEEVEAQEQSYEQSKKPSGVEVARNLSEVYVVPGTRVSAPKFVAESMDVVIEEPNTGRLFHDVKITPQEQTRREIQAGHKCLKCLEPQPIAFPEFCDLCGYEMRERQVLDVAMEFEGETHVGPSKPMREYLVEQDLRVEQAKFDKAVAEGKSRMRGLR